MCVPVKTHCTMCKTHGVKVTNGSSLTRAGTDGKSQTLVEETFTLKTPPLMHSCIWYVFYCFCFLLLFCENFVVVVVLPICSIIS